ncbi:hypothetical protein LAZ67_4003877 [Cordylochernes scorpioides]|uniref:Reverse transcriptase domain-containing protein n=1 Tax=Cordylochernes scorpioides TaxID=51811 RepID=A0ABY6KH38_9ARAC|nr:hypothetical protein LAZ67_4003877 [Cordylochernes scorpioides]
MTSARTAIEENGSLRSKKYQKVFILCALEMERRSMQKPHSPIQWTSLWPSPEPHRPNDPAYELTRAPRSSSPVSGQPFSQPLKQQHAKCQLYLISRNIISEGSNTRLEGAQGSQRVWLPDKTVVIWQTSRNKNDEEEYQVVQINDALDMDEHYSLVDWTCCKFVGSQVETRADGQKRLCVDYRRLNALTIDDKMPLPDIQEVIDRLQGAKYFTSLDIASGYWHVEMAPDSTVKTAFITNEGLYECSRHQGPFFVKNKISSLVYDIQDTEGRVYRAHASQLRSFKDRESLGAGECDGWTSLWPSPEPHRPNDPAYDLTRAPRSSSPVSGQPFSQTLKQQHAKCQLYLISRYTLHWLLRL